LIRFFVVVFWLRRIDVVVFALSRKDASFEQRRGQGTPRVLQNIFGENLEDVAVDGETTTYVGSQPLFATLWLDFWFSIQTQNLSSYNDRG
jgi:hypothetical protein